MLNLSEIDKIFFPYLDQRIQHIQKKDTSFAHYTNATTAIKIIKNGEFWMRSVMDMNDLSEVDFGCERVFNAFKKNKLRKKYNDALKNMK